MTEYLLDTCIIRALGNNDEQKLSQKGNFSLTASYLVPFELLSGTKPSNTSEADEENKRRKAALGRYYRLVGFDNTYWEDERSITLKAFGIKCPSRDISDIRQLIQDYVEAENLEDVEKRYAILLGDIREWDNTKKDAYLQELISIQQEVKKIPSFRSMDEGTVLLLITALVSYFSAEHEDLGLTSAAYAVLENEFGNLTNEKFVKLSECLLPKYDGSLDFLIKFLTEYLKQSRTYNRKDKSKGNDVFDWGHITYLKPDTTTYFVTEDIFLYDLLAKVASDKVMRKDDFINHICTNVIKY